MVAGSTKPVKKLKRVAILSEFIYNTGGVEKAILLVRQELLKRGIEVDIYAGLYDPAKTFPEFKQIPIRAFRNKRYPSFLNTLDLRRRFRNIRLKGYDGFIFFGYHSIAAGKHHHPNVWWCIGPLSYLYGLRGTGPDEGIKYMYGNNIVKKWLIHLYLRVLKIVDQADVKGVDFPGIVGEIIERKYKNAYPGRFYGWLRPPAEVETFKYLSKGKYYLSLCRLSADKNVDRIIKAFQSMPDKQLYFGGGGPDKDKLIEMSKGYKNIKFIGFLSEQELRKVVGNSIAMISASENEDFSMNLIESLSAGKPTISTNPDREYKGMVVTPTGIYSENSKPENIIKAVNYLSVDRAVKMKKDCLKRAKLYSLQNFMNTILDALQK